MKVRGRAFLLAPGVFSLIYYSLKIKLNQFHPETCLLTQRWLVRARVDGNQGGVFSFIIIIYSLLMARLRRRVCSHLFIYC